MNKIKEYKVKRKDRRDYYKRSNKELKELAVGCYRGDVFTSFQVHNQQYIGMVFMPLMMMDPRKDAFPTGVNGYPCFGSVAHLNKADAKKFWTYYKRIENKINAI